MNSGEIFNLIKERLESENIDYKDYRVLIMSRANILDGVRIPDEITFSDDETYVRILVPIPDEMTDDIYYRSTEYFIASRFSTFIPIGEMQVNSQIFLLK